MYKQGGKLPHLVTHHSSKKDMLKEIVHDFERKRTQVLVVLPAHKAPLAPPPILASAVKIILELYFKHIKKSYLSNTKNIF